RQGARTAAGAVGAAAEILTRPLLYVAVLPRSRLSFAQRKPEFCEFHWVGSKPPEEPAMPAKFVYLPVACVLILAGAAPALAAEMDVPSAIDAVTVYPDGATVTRLITVDLPAGDTTLIARDFPPGLDPASLRVEGESGAALTIGAIYARPPRTERPV